jgi:hypothetical protein
MEAAGDPRESTTHSDDSIRRDYAGLPYGAVMSVLWWEEPDARTGAAGL